NLKPAKRDPGNEIERIFIKVWMDVLNVDEIGVTDNFFELGGDSIKAVQISSRLFEEGISVKSKHILIYHTIENISCYAKPANGRNQYEQGVVEGEFLPTPIQSWFFSHHFENSNYYNHSLLLKINTSLDTTILEKTFNILIEHHDSFRINYDQKRHSFYYNNELLKEKIDVQEFAVSGDQTLSGICDEIKRSFDISNGLLIKIAIIKLHDGIENLFITTHHLVMDSISWRILMEDFHKAYSAIANGVEVNFIQKTASFKDWSALLYQLSLSKEFETERDYWNKMNEVNFTLPFDFAANDLLIKNSKKTWVSLDKERTGFLLKDAHKPYNTDVPILLNTALVLTLNRWTGLEEFVIEQENHGRHLEELDTSRTIGWFTAMYPIKLVYNDDIDTLIRSVKETMRKVPNNGIGYGVNAFLTSSDTDQISKLSEVRLNYLGQFGRELSNELVTLSHDSTGVEV
ncbi:MAG: non-ribosomal peptide synthetase, partial [Marivirga sp.]|nr:non-ribosomal peptide synthetase [Marivirga sp.]